jgi:hypothetical protein
MNACGLERCFGARAPRLDYRRALANSRPVPRDPISEAPARLDFVRGDAMGLAIPAHGAALREAGAGFLTEAFRKFGAIGPGNRVARIDRIEDCPGGSTGSKLFLSVAYDGTEPGLHRELFVKFSRDFGDALRDRGKYEMESEVRFAALSRLPGFPIRVPRAYFADYHQASQTGLLITERIAFGEGGIEVQREKCMDHLLDDPLAYYRAVLKALARIAAAHKSGLLAGEVETLFPYDPASAAAADPIPWSEDELRRVIARYALFADECPQLMPECAHERGFWAKLEREAMDFLRQEAAIKRWLQADRDYIALCHWNANIDNAWFWRGEAGELDCGLMDWGRVRQLNLAFAVWGCLLSAPVWLWDDHLDELLALFVDELARHSGPRLDPGRLKLSMDMYVATMGLALLMEAPMRIRRYLPDAAAVTGPLDPRLLANERARNQRQISALFLHLWDRHGFGRVLEALRLG